MMLRILILKLKRKFIWARHEEQRPSWERYEHALYSDAHKKLKKLSEKNIKELIKVYELLDHGGFPEHPAKLEQALYDRTHKLCTSYVW